ncbi:urate oxidase [Microbacterium pseudoresistens]|uniref:Uricase n=1 Tax=Microbacterium pseudoresistens TaxID=640634 RepID=A0A7Y9EX91_9MICO|nr:urate oxidase [Microbacterium pseudoresistens]NYD54725.1 urate oxidase [Microbacterium pseudoresistens]
MTDILTNPVETTATDSGIVLGANQYGKAEVRVVKITRDSERHEIDDLNVTSQLHGDFEAAHLEGDNGHVVATDTQKNTIFSFSRDGIGTPEAFLLRLSDHFTSSFDWVSGGRWEAEKYEWERIQVDGEGHDHSFVRKGQETRTAYVLADGDERHVVQGLKGLTVLKSTEAGFVGYPKDRYTSLQETTDRILSTDVTARWRFAEGSRDLDFDAIYADVKRILLEEFTRRYSAALQTTMFDMGRAVLEAHPEIAEIRMSMPNKHHFLVDLSPYQLDNPGEVFFASDRSYGLIEASVTREGSDPALKVWQSATAFC